MILPTDIYGWRHDELRLWLIGVTKIILEEIDISKYKNYGITSMSVFAAAISAMVISLWKWQRWKNCSPRRGIHLRERYNAPRSIFYANVKYLNDLHGLL